MDKEYSTIAGSAEFCQHSINLALGDGNEVVANGLVSANNAKLYTKVFVLYKNCFLDCYSSRNFWYWFFICRCAISISSFPRQQRHIPADTFLGKSYSFV